MRTLLYILSLSTLVACSTNELELSSKLKAPGVKFDVLTSKAIIGEIKRHKSTDKQVKSFYKNIDHHVVWFDSSLYTKDAVSFQNILEYSEAYGLDSTVFNLNGLKTLDGVESNQINSVLAKNDLFLTGMYFQFLEKVSQGYIDSIPYGNGKINRHKRKKTIGERVEKEFRDKNLLGLMEDIQPNQKAYKDLIKASLEYFKKYPEDIEVKNVPSVKEDSLKARINASENLYKLGLMDSLGLQNDSVFELVLKMYQKDHGLLPDGVIGENTAKALSKGTRYYKDLLKLNIERWRWEENWDEDHILVNIPSYELQFIDSNKVQWTNSVVVGRRYSKTPIFSDTLKYMVAFPFWNVPYSISSSEILPKLKKDSTYLLANNYELFDAGNQIVDATCIDWTEYSSSNFPFRIRQKGGSFNALGLVKFIFPNDNNVYIHDTNLKRFFNNEIRAYSHGCIRLKDPMELAERLVEYNEDSITTDSLSHFVSNKERRVINMSKSVEVHVKYFTAMVNEKGNLVFYHDVYGYDKKMIKEEGLM